MKEKPASSSELLFKNRNKQTCKPTQLRRATRSSEDNKEEVSPGPVHKAYRRRESFSLGSRTTGTFPDFMLSSPSLCSVLLSLSVHPGVRAGLAV